MQTVPQFSSQNLTAICKILADTSDGLIGSQIEYLLQDCRIPDVSPGATKWKRLFNALAGFQNERQFGNHVVVFINKAMNPVQYTSNPRVFRERRDKLNSVLSFSGLFIGDDGKIRWSSKANNLDEALARANRLHGILISRDVHQDLLAFCKAELLQENYFHAVFEAMKSIADKIRHMSGVDGDGAQLVDRVFGFRDGELPLIMINPVLTETQKGEQRGFCNLLKGLFGTIRNPLAHNPKIEWNMSEQDALDIFSTLSLVHRKLDKAQKLKATSAD